VGIYPLPSLITWDVLGGFQRTRGSPAASRSTLESPVPSPLYYQVRCDLSSKIYRDFTAERQRQAGSTSAVTHLRRLATRTSNSNAVLLYSLSSPGSPNSRSGTDYRPFFFLFFLADTNAIFLEGRRIMLHFRDKFFSPLFVTKCDPRPKIFHGRVESAEDTRQASSPSTIAPRTPNESASDDRDF
jgi:hypothetical protein